MMNRICVSPILLLIVLTVSLEAQPKAGDWKVPTHFGQFVFTVNSGGTQIIKLATTFSNYAFGGITQNGTVTSQPSPGWPISNSQFAFTNSINPAGTIKLTLDGTFAQSGDQASGTWSILVNGQTDSDAWGPVTIASKPSPPILVFPANAATGISTYPTLSWNASSGATSYRLLVSTSSSFTATVVDDSTLTSTSKQIGPLSNNTIYYWRVNAKNEAGISDWSPVWSFTTMASMQGRSLADLQPFPYEDPWWSSPSNVGFNPIGVTNSIVLTLFRGNDTLYSIVSSDTGMTWSARQFVRVLGPSVSTFRAVRLNSGRILLTWRDNDGIKTSFSDNNGGSFPGTTTIAAALNTPYEISQTDDSRVWLSYTRSNGSNSDSFFLISVDSGKTWGSERTLANTSGNESGGVFFSGSGSTVVGMFSSYVAGNRTFLYSQGSTDSGLTWSAPTKVFNDTLERFTPHVLKNSSGTLTLVCSVNNYRIYSNFLGSVLYPGGYARSDIFTYSSANNGSTWTQPTQFTRYAGSDNNPLTGLVGDRVFISFLSARWVSGNAWYGIAGRTLDMSAPPFVSYVSIPSAEQGVRCDAQIEVFDAAGIKDAKVSYVLRGVTYGPFQLYDDGVHNDYNANDGTYGGPTGLFSVGDSINMTYTITSNTLSYIIWTRSAINPAVHNAGNVKLAVNSNSLLGSNGNNYSGTWPKANGTNYLNIAGLWVGGLAGGGARVLKAGESGTGDWHQTAGSSFALTPGTSDQDISVTYDDSLATSTTALGIRVFQKSYVWASASRSDFVILTYRVVNRGMSGKIDSVFVGLWADGDVKPSPATNASGYDATRNLLYVTNSTRTGGMIGIRPLGHKASLRTARSYDFYGVPAFTDSAYMVMIKSGNPGVAATLGDYRMLAIAQPFPLAGGESSTVAFGMVFGNGLAALQANADSMEAVYEGSVLTAPRLRLNTAKMDIGLVLLGKSKDTTITISNTGSDTLRISTINNSLPGITIKSTFLSIPPNGFAVDTIRFAPTVVGPISGALLILSNAPTSPDTVRVTASGVTGATGIAHEGVPQAFGVKQNYPNPFNPSTTIRYELPKPAIVSLKIYSTLGQLLATLEDAKKEAGYYQVQWNASNVPSGIYFYRLQAGEYTEAKKMILLR